VDRSGGRHFSDPIFLTNAWPEKARKGQKHRVRKMGATGTEGVPKGVWPFFVRCQQGSGRCLLVLFREENDCTHRRPHARRLGYPFP
jgi:hypothetical protein